MVLMIIVFGVLLVVLFMAVGIYNGLVSLKNQVQRSWANIDVILKQRFDEIPQLLEVIEQYVGHEKAMIREVMDARTRYGSARGIAEKIEASKEMSFALKGVLSIGEAYPELKSNENFSRLQNRVSDLESQLSDRREHYNESVTNFNTRLEQIPDVFFARILGYQPKNLFQVNESEKVRPSLKMNLG